MHSLFRGTRGLPRRSSLAKLLAKKRGVRNRLNLPTLTIEQILKWADAHHAKTGRWPKQDSGDVLDALGETWGGIKAALFAGSRGLPGGSSLAQLLAEKRSVRNVRALPSLTEARILQWVDAHHAKTGRWPRENSGAVLGAPGEKWVNITAALRSGTRGLPGGSSLAKLLADKRRVRVSRN
jgi:hypothetical protein